MPTGLTRGIGNGLNGSLSGEGGAGSARAASTAAIGIGASCAATAPRRRNSGGRKPSRWQSGRSIRPASGVFTNSAAISGSRSR
jgi:hypothetical protein